MRVVDLPTEQYSERDEDRPIRYIVRHTTQGTDSRRWLTETGGVSAHYLLRNEDGEAVIYRIVPEHFAAWHAGRVRGTPTNPLVVGSRGLDGEWDPNPNLASIGIEIEGFAAGPVDPILVRAFVDLASEIRARRGPLPFVDHREISPADRSDPGIWAMAIAALEDDMTDDEFLEKLHRLYTPGLQKQLEDTVYVPLAVAQSQIASFVFNYGKHGHATSGPT